MIINPHQKGFTLLEVLIALVVFAILATITSSMLYNAFTTRERINEQSRMMSTIQFAVTVINRDLEQFIDRTVTMPRHHRQPSIFGEHDYVTFTRSGLANPLGQEHRSTLQRVSLRCDKGSLIRRVWPHPDMPKDVPFRDSILLKHLKACSFQYLDDKYQVLDSWSEQRQKDRKVILPMSVLIHLDIPKAGVLNLHEIIPKGLYDD